MGIESWDKALKAERHNSDSGRACAGLDMRKVPARAVAELVEAAIPFSRFACGCGECFNCKLHAALAPFVKEEHEYKPGPWDDDRDDEF